MKRKVQLAIALGNALLRWSNEKQCPDGKAPQRYFLTVFEPESPTSSFVRSVFSEVISRIMSTDAMFARYWLGGTESTAIRNQSRNAWTKKEKGTHRQYGSVPLVPCSVIFRTSSDFYLPWSRKKFFIYFLRFLSDLSEAGH
jgi:hypothetical protein